MGCKAATRLEQLDHVGETLEGDDCTHFRALAARALYLSLDRPDVMYSAKELCRDFASPGISSVVKLKRLVRCLVRYPRLVWRYDYCSHHKFLDVMSDTDFGGCLRTRRSTSGGVARLGDHIIKCWSKTQRVVALSSAEVEFTGLCQAAGEGLGLQAICQDLGLPVALRVHSDSSAAIGICRRRGLGRVRHLAVADLWRQDRLRSGDFEVLKVAGSADARDLCTKYLDKATHFKHCTSMGLEFEEGRSVIAPQISQLVVPCPLSSLYDPEEYADCRVLWGGSRSALPLHNVEAFPSRTGTSLP